MPDENLPQRTLKTTLYVTILFTILFALRGQTTIALGLAIGAMLGIVSLWSLTFAVPRLFHSANPAAKFLLGMLLFCKLPFYAVVLDFAMTSKAVSPFSVFVGVALIPVVVVLKVVGYQMLQKAETPTPAESLS